MSPEQAQHDSAGSQCPLGMCQGWDMGLAEAGGSWAVPGSAEAPALSITGTRQPPMGKPVVLHPSFLSWNSSVLGFCHKT